MSARYAGAGHPPPTVAGPGRRQGVKAVLALALLGWAGNAMAQDGASARDLSDLLRSVVAADQARSGVAPREAARVTKGRTGGLSYLGAPPGYAFPTRAARGGAEVSARAFLDGHRDLFALGANDALRLRREKTSSDRTWVRFQQLHRSLPVLAGEIVVQVGGGGIEAVMCDIAAGAETAALPTAAAISRDQAAAIATSTAADLYGAADASVVSLDLEYFVPAVLGEPGDPALAWVVTVSSEMVISAHERVVLDAVRGEVLRRYPLHESALNRQIYDASLTSADPGTLKRSEGDPPSTLADINLTYDYLGDTYAFYLSHHGRDSFDDAGAVLSATVNYCGFPGCDNAQFLATNGRMYVGPDFAVDDVLAHEYTHGVTASESGLYYANTPGALNESLSDVWGEFVDLSNGAGNDAAVWRWRLGEDLLGPNGRDMRDPTIFSDPDRLSSPFYVPPVGSPDTLNDYGGVHTNSGVNNKLCYLLTDGDTFNGQVVAGMGIDAVADLYYEANTHLLTSGSGWVDLYDALRQAAISLGWSSADRTNLDRACLAVEIAPPSKLLWVDGASTCSPAAGYFECRVAGGPFQIVADAVTAADPGALIRVRAGHYAESVTISKSVVLSSWLGTARIGGP